MRILMVSDIGVPLGGAESVIQRTIAELRRRGNEVKLLAGDAPAPQPDFCDYSFRAADSSRIGKFLFHLHNPWATRSVRRAVAGFQPDVINLHIVSRLSPAGVRACLRAAPTLMTIHYLGLFYPRLYKSVPRSAYCGINDKACCSRHAGILRYNFEFFCTSRHYRNFKSLSAIIVPSEYVKKIVESQGCGVAYNLGNPIDISPYMSGEKKQVIENSVLFAGRLEPEKEVTRLIQSFEIVNKKIPESKLFIAGEGALKPKLIALIQGKELGESIKLLGRLDSAELDAWYQKTKIVAVPSVLPEPFQMAGPEAMRFGVPVVASGEGGISEWLRHDFNGLVADPSNKEEFANAIICLMQDESLYARLSANTRRSVERFRTDAYVDKLVSLYEKALNDKQVSAAATAAKK